MVKRFFSLFLFALLAVATAPVSTAGGGGPLPPEASAVTASGELSPTPMRAEFDGLDAFGQFLSDVERRAADPAPLMREVAELGRSSAQERIREGDFKGNAPGTVAAKGSSKPLVDRGRYLGSISVAYGSDFAAWGSDLPQAPLLNDGGTVTPKRGRFLAFPTNDRAKRLVRRYGSPRAAVQGAREDGYRVWTVVRPGADSGAVLAQKGRRGKRFVLLVLKASVTVPPRPHFVLDASDEADIERLAARWLAGRVL